jgi:hypothetical protein
MVTWSDYCDGQTGVHVNTAHDQHGRFAKREGGPAVKAAKKQEWGTFDELGRPSKTTYGGTLYQDYVPALNGKQCIRTMKEMSNDPSAGSVLFAIEMHLRRMAWSVEPYDDTPQDLDAARFLEECRQDMSHTWADHMAAATSMLPFGFAPFEIVYRQRTLEGNSRFNDGRIGWRRFGFRPQDTLDRWERDADGGLAGMWQDTGKGVIFIPIEKLLLYQVRPGMGDPESRSIFRSAYKAYYFKKRAEEITLISLERAGVGMPRVRMPAGSIIAGDTVYQRYEQIAQRLKVDEQMGIVIPSDKWPVEDGGGYMYDIDYMPTPGAPPIDGIQLIRMYAADIAATVLADFLSLGRDATGSRALADPKQELFQQALGAWADSMEEAINRFAVPRLFALNDFKVDRLPVIKHGPVEKVDLEELGNFVLRVSQAGHDWGFMAEGDTMAAQVRSLAGFDPAPEQKALKRGGQARLPL